MNPNFGELYFDHFSKFLGEPAYVAGRFEENQLAPVIQFLAYDGVLQGCATFCSLGLTHFHDRLDGVAEIVSFVDVHHPQPLKQYFDTIPYVLANTLFFMVQKRMKLGRGMVVSGIDNISSAFVVETGKDSIYFTTPFDLPTDFSHVGDKTGSVLLAMFITKSEHDYFKDRGTEEFESLLEKKKVDPYDLERASCV